MNKAQIKEWLHFYVNLIGISIWNGTVNYLKVAIGAGSVGVAQGFDIRTVQPSLLGWTWLSAVVVYVVIELSKNLLPTPKPPVPPEPTVSS